MISVRRDDRAARALEKLLVKILFVDDEPHILLALKRALQAERYELVFSSSASEAIEELSRNRYDVIISDNRMPETSGVDLLREVRRKFPSTLRVLMSAYTEADDKRRAQQEGAVDWFIEKPWDTVELKKLLRAIKGVRSL
jgi:DNA-binding NtrC family response regulator